MFSAMPKSPALAPSPLRAAPDSVPPPAPGSTHGKRPGFGLEPPEALAPRPLHTRLSPGQGRRAVWSAGRPDRQWSSRMPRCAVGPAGQGASRAEHCLAGHPAPATKPGPGPRVSGSRQDPSGPAGRPTDRALPAGRPSDRALPAGRPSDRALPAGRPSGRALPAGRYGRRPTVHRKGNRRCTGTPYRRPTNYVVECVGV
jgi:hypothetical protein